MGGSSIYEACRVFFFFFLKRASGVTDGKVTMYFINERKMRWFLNLSCCVCVFLNFPLINRKMTFLFSSALFMPIVIPQPDQDLKHQRFIFIPPTKTPNATCTHTPPSHHPQNVRLVSCPHIPHRAIHSDLPKSLALMFIS